MEQPSGPADSAGMPPGAAQGIPDGAGEPGGSLITLTVNGEQRRVPADLTLPAVLQALGYRPQLVVVEFNGEILPRQQWSEQAVVETDVLEVVTIVGGGS
jgi:sulfur carrier protein